MLPVTTVRFPLRARTTAPLIGLCLAACTSDVKPPVEPPPVVPDNCRGATNALDQSLCAELYGASYHPIIAGDAEVCARLFIDMIGIRASSERIQNECAGKPLVEVITALQKTEEYRKQQR